MPDIATITITNPPWDTIDLHGNRDHCTCTNPDLIIETTTPNGTITETAHIPDGTQPPYPWDTETEGS